MTIINDKLFGQIQNAATLKGTGLQGNIFTETIDYLKQYIDNPLSKAPDAYKKLINNAQSIATINENIAENSNLADIYFKAEVSKEIATTILSLQKEESIFLPGGWYKKSGGHCMIYEFSREEDEFKFTVYNYGAGLEYHAKQSDPKNDRYNPMKVWKFAIPNDDIQKNELTIFVNKILSPQRIKPAEETINAHILYNLIFPSIAQLDGEEVMDMDAELKARTIDKNFNCDPYTSSALSGTSSQRCLHQLLKIKSDSTENYQRFIYNFKQYALYDYTEQFITQSNPNFTKAVSTQIREAIENNLKILHLPGLFTSEEKTQELTKIAELQEKLAQITPTVLTKAEVGKEEPAQLRIFDRDNKIVAPTLSTEISAPEIIIVKPLPTNGKDLLKEFENAIAAIVKIDNPFAKYKAIETLLLQCPTQPFNNNDFYNDILEKDKLFEFRQMLETLQNNLMNLQNGTHKNFQTPSFNASLVLLINLQAHAYDAENNKKQLASFESINESVIQSIVSNNDRNPFIATTNPLLDAKVKEIADRVQFKSSQSYLDLYKYFDLLLNKEFYLHRELKEHYKERFEANDSELQTSIRANKLTAVHMIELHLSHTETLPDKFDPLINLLSDHLNYQTLIAKAVKPFFEQQYTQSVIEMRIDNYHNFYCDTDLYPTTLSNCVRSSALQNHKYQLNNESFVQRALAIDVANKSSAAERLTVKAPNAIQLEPLLKSPTNFPNCPVTQADIVARDYLHLRTVPELQISLTLDYFNRNISKLSETDNQRYLEANLFQPPLLLEAVKKKGFIGQFDRLINTGLDYFAKNSQYTLNSLIFIRLQFLINRYLTLLDIPEGHNRLENLRVELIKQIKNITNPDLSHVFHQYLFLTLITQIEANADDDSLFEDALTSYLYLKGHDSPQILEDTAHRVEMETAFAQFQNQMQIKQNTVATKSKNTDAILRLIPKIITDHRPPLPPNLQIVGTYPNYELVDKNSDKVYVLNVNLGKIFENGFAQSGVPLSIQKHPLIKHLGLAGYNECLMTADEKHIRIQTTQGLVEIYQAKPDSIVLYKEWTIAEQTESYELQALSTKDPVYYINSNYAVRHSLPKLLEDHGINYWKAIKKDSSKALITRNNIPIYRIEQDQLFELDTKGQETGYKLSPLNNMDCLNEDYLQTLNQFESLDFIIGQKSDKNSIVKLERFDLKFTIDNQANSVPMLIENNERLVIADSPIDNRVAGLLLESNTNQRRYLIAVARFYALEEDVEKSDFYPIVHDKTNEIAALEIGMKAAKTIRWEHPHSQEYISLKLKDDQPTPENVSDALYLAYVYMACNQTEKAWEILELCTTRFGGLTGDPKELKYIRWIFEEMPTILKSDKKTLKAKRNTPPYVACRLKAMALLADYLRKDKLFEFKNPTDAQDTLNVRSQLQEQKQSQEFLNTIRKTLYGTYSRYQRMNRHRTYHYTLSFRERKLLLDYYHDSGSAEKNPLGALGYEWRQLSLETLLQEKDHLMALNLAQGSLSETDKQRLEFISKRLNALTSILSVSTDLDKVPINLTLDPDQQVNSQTYNFQKWSKDLIYSTPRFSKIKQAIDDLASDISEDDFISNFPAYFAVAIDPKAPQFKRLHTFCTRVLIANRFIPLRRANSNIPILCNLLYRLMDNQDEYERLTKQKNHISLTDLIKVFSQKSVTPLYLYQAKDAYAEIVTDLATLLEKPRPQKKALQTPALNESEIIQLYVHLQENHSEEFNQLTLLITKHRQLEADCTAKIKSLSENVTADVRAAYVIEKEAGTLLRDLELEQRQLTQTLKKDPTFLKILLDTTTEQNDLISNSAQAAWKQSLMDANEGPKADTELAEIWANQKRVRTRAPLQPADLLKLYLHADATYSMEVTGLDSEKVQALHEQIHKALVLDIQQQCLQKIQSKLAEFQEYDHTIALAEALALLAKPEIPGLTNSKLMIIQHQDKIILRTRQAEALEALLKKPASDKPFQELVEKITMGGGKSKVILPTLAEEKAFGHNLVVVEVPPALFATNYVDLNRTSQRLYGKQVFPFEFSRDSNCSPERLEQIYKQFIETMTMKSYIVTTGETIVSLQLKYIELLRYQGESTAAWEKQIYWCDKIVNLLLHNSDVIIDEVHQGLSIKKKLNYTVGKSRPIDSSTIEYAIALYELIDPVYIQTGDTFPPNYDWSAFKAELTQKLLTEEKSPLHHFIETAKINSFDVEKELTAYLTNSSDKLSHLILNATPEERSMLAFFKEEINVLLPNTLSCKLDVQYGASDLQGIDPIARTLAIPFEGNNQPLNGSRFANEIKAINSTIQMMLIKGISRELLIQTICEWQATALQEHLLTKVPTEIDDTPTAQGVRILLPEIKEKLSAIDVNNDEQIDALHEVLKHNQSLIFNLLENNALKQINREDEIIHGNCYSHVDQYRSVQGITGTPSNNTTYHQRLAYDRRASLGSDGYILEILTEKNTRISSCDYKNIDQFLDGIWLTSPDKDRVRAIIDINSTFKGEKNSSTTIARQINNYIKNQAEHSDDNAFKQFEHVLYFNKDQILCALKIGSPEKPIVLATSNIDEINHILGNKPENRFTYYDQIHTLGTDITQADTAHALVLADEKVTLQDFLQGTSRMRSINLNQSVEIIVPTRIKDATLKSLFDTLAKNEQDSIYMDNLIAVKAQMANHIRRDLLNIIQNIAPEDCYKKQHLMKEFQPLFVETPSFNFFELYGGISKTQNTEDILYRTKLELETVWGNCLKKASLPVLSDTQKNELEAIIERALPNLLPTYQSANESFDQEVQIQIEVQTQLLVEIETLKQDYSINLIAAPEEMDYSFNCERFHLDPDHYATDKMTMNSMCGQKMLFTNEFRATSNFANVYENPKNKVDAFTKPVMLVWYYLDDYNKLYATLITNNDYLYLKKLKSFYKHNASWIATMQDDVIIGTPIANAEDNTQYRILREQARFFNGELNLLLEEKTPLQWLTENSGEKITYFEKNLLAIRPHSSAFFKPLEVALLQTNPLVYKKLIQYAYAKSPTIIWNNIAPFATKNHIKDYLNVLGALKQVNSSWIDTNPDIQELRSHHRFPVNAAPMIVEHSKNLGDLKNLFNYILQTEPTHFLKDLSEKHKSILKIFLGVSYDDLIQLYITDESNIESWEFASVNVLLLLFNHPAIYKPSLLYPHLEQYAAKTQSEAVLKCLSQLKVALEALNSIIVKNPVCTNDIIKTLLDSRKVSDACQTEIINKKSISQEILTTLAKNHCNNASQLIKLLEHDNAGSETRLAAIDNKVFSIEVAQAIVPKLAHKPDLAVFKNLAYKLLIMRHSANVDKTMCEKLLTSLFENKTEEEQIAIMSDFIKEKQPGSEDLIYMVSKTLKNPEIIQKIPMTEYVKYADEADVIRLLESQLGFIDDQIRDFSSKVESAECINKMLDNSAMTKDIAEILLMKPNFSGVVKKWDWLTDPAQKLRFLKKATDPASVDILLENNNIDSAALDAWIADENAFTAQHAEALLESNAIYSNDTLKNAVTAKVQTHYDRPEQELIWEKAYVVLLLALKRNPATTIAELDNIDSTCLKIASSTSSANTLCYLLQIGELSKALVDSIFANSNVNETMLLEALKQDKISSEALVYIANNKLKVSETLLLKLVAHKNANDALLNKAMTMSAFSLEVAKAIQIKHGVQPDSSVMRNLVSTLYGHTVYYVERFQFDTIIRNAFKGDKTKVTADLISTFIKEKRPNLDCLVNIYRLFSEKPIICAQVKIDNFLEYSSEDDIVKLCNSSLRLSVEQLTSCAEKVTTTKSIDTILALSQMSDKIASVLCNKPNFSGKIKQWNWLKDPKLIVTLLDKADSYASLKLLLDNPYTDQNMLKKWIGDLKITQTQLDNAQDSNGKLMATLHRLKLKACEHAVKAKANPQKYSEVAESAFNLHRQIKGFIAKNLSKDSLVKECNNAISKSEHILNKHRGYKQIVVDFFNCLLVCLKFKKIGTNEWRFFKVNTDTMNIASSIPEAAKKLP